MLRTRTLPLLGLLAWTLLVAACGPSGTPNTSKTVRSSAYPLDHHPDAVIASATSNMIIVRARVHRTDPQQTYSVPGIDHEFAFTPVNVVVIEAFRGGHNPGDALTLRILGGERGNISYIGNDAPPIEVFTDGSEFMVFAQEVVTIDSIDGATPNHVYLLDDRGEMKDVSSRQSVVSATFEFAQFEARLRRQLDQQPTD